MSVQIEGISGYNEDQVALMACSSAEFAHHIPVILGTPTMDRAIKTLKESEIDKLATPWACVRKSTLLQVATTRVAAVRADVAMKTHRHHRLQRTHASVGTGGGRTF